MKKILLIMMLFSTILFGLSIQEVKLFQEASILADKGESHQALKKVNILIKINPKNVNYWVLKGQILKDLKRYEEAKILLKKALEKKPDDEKIRKLLSDIEEIENMSKNDVVKKALNWLNDKGVDLLFMFLGVLGGELLIGAFTECKKEEKKLVKIFVDKVLYKYSKENVGCIFINFLIIATLSLVFTIITLFIILLFNPPIFHLDTLTPDKFWILIGVIYISLFLIISLVFFYQFKRQKIEIEDVALLLMKMYETKQYDKLKEELLLISKLSQDYIDKIFQKIIFEDVRERIREFYELVKD